MTTPFFAHYRIARRYSGFWQALWIAKAFTRLPRALPELDAPAQLAWREGWWTGIAVGFVTGLALAVVALLHR